MTSIASEQKFKSALRWTLVGLILLGFIAINWMFWSPILIAGIFALGLHDSLDKAALKIPFKRVFVMVVFTLVLVTALFLPFGLAMYRLAIKINMAYSGSGEGLVANLNHLKEFILLKVQTVAEFVGIDITDPIRDTIEKVSVQFAQTMFEGSSHLLAKLPSLALSTFVFVLLLLTFLTKSKEVKAWFLDVDLMSEGHSLKFIDLLKSTCSTILLSTFLVGFVQAIIIGVGSAIFKVGDFWVVLGLTFVFSFVPMVGAAPVGFVLAAIAFMQDQVGAGFGLAAFAMVSGTIDNIIKPLLIGRRIEAHPLMAFMAAIGATALMGLPGLLVGPLLMNLFIAGIPLLLKD